MGDPLEKIIEKGWGQMSKSLDETMPVTRFNHFQKYRYYYSTAMVFLIIIFSVVWLNDGTFEMKRSLAFLNENNSALQNQNSYDESLNNYITPYIIDNKAFVIRDYVRSGVFDDISGSDSDFEDHRSQRNLNSTDIYYNEENSLEPLPINKNPEISGDFSQEDNKRLSFNFERKINEEVLSHKDDNDVAELVPESFKHNTISISVNSINEDLKSFGGIDGGISYAYRLNKSFGFMTGIEHSLFSRNKMSYDLQNFQKAVSSSENDNSGLSGMEQNVNTNNEKLYYVGIPLGFLYSIDKFTISAGVKFSYLVSATDYAGSYSRENQQAMALIKDVTANEAGIYNKFDYSFIFGFEFHVLKDFSIFSRFNYAYSSMINSYSYNENPIGDLFIVTGLENNLRDKPDKNIYFGLGIKYDLAKK
ncbi:MAG: hypothetical protein IPH57_03535 [Saprospiraceae bacterium]|nr:hypothetical protein [Saprospiraceae bacterium]